MFGCQPQIVILTLYLIGKKVEFIDMTIISFNGQELNFSNMLTKSVKNTIIVQLFLVLENLFLKSIKTKVSVHKLLFSKDWTSPLIKSQHRISKNIAI